jgi:hypothetical protein
MVKWLPRFSAAGATAPMLLKSMRSARLVAIARRSDLVARRRDVALTFMSRFIKSY